MAVSSPVKDSASLSLRLATLVHAMLDGQNSALLTSAAHGSAIRRHGHPEPDRLPQLSLHTPVGDITLSEEDGAIVALDWGWGRDQTPTPLLKRARDQLQAYFDGEKVCFDLPLSPAGSPYRQRVWRTLTTIPHGETRTYGEMAALAGGSPRSVGGANGANPVPILIPCHRVVAAASLGGYSGGNGLQTKRALLVLEAGSRGTGPSLAARTLPEPSLSKHDHRRSA